MRKLYAERIRERLRRGDLPWLARHVLRYAGVRLSHALNRPLTGPILGTLITNYSCNLRCKMCDLPLRVGDHARDGLRPLATDEMLDVIDDFADLGTLGLGFTGGEPMLRKDLFQLLERSRRRGMITHLNTNGTFVTEEAATRLVSLEIDSVNLSLDGATPETHDAIRAKPGSFDEVKEAAQRLRRERGRIGGTRPRIKLVCVLSRHNLGEAEDLVAQRGEIGADAVDFIPVHDFDAPGSTRGEAILDPAEPDLDRRARDLARRLRELGRTEPIENSPAHLGLLPRALRGEASPLRCFAGFNSLAVDGYGRIFPCVPWSNKDRSAGNVRETPLRTFWRSREYAATRREVAECRDCYLNCQTELNLLFNPRRRRRDPARP